MRDRDPEHVDIQKIVVDSFPPSALDRIVVRIQKFRKPTPTLSEALVIARSVPFTLVESTSSGQALQIVKDLEKIEVQSHPETSGQKKNPFFGQTQSDRVEYHACRQHGDVALPWIEVEGVAPADISEIRCMACGGLGTLLQTPPAVLCCPACRQADLVDAGFWVT